MIVRRVTGCMNAHIEVDGKHDFHEPDIIERLLEKIPPQNLWQILDCIPPTSEQYIGDECEQCGDTNYEEIWII